MITHRASINYFSHISFGPRLIACQSFIKIQTTGQTDFISVFYCEGVESYTTCSPVPT